MKSTLTKMLIIVSVLVVVGCASTKKPLNTNDPYESFNRASFRFNDKLDKIILKPAAKVYDKVMPRPLNTGLDHVFENVNDIPDMLNDILQGNFYQATSDCWRFAINSTVGVAGFFDVASNIGLSQNNEDFGLTLAHWGYKQSDYLVLPFLGPKTVRDTVGLPVDYFSTVYPYIGELPERSSLLAARVVDKRANLLRYQKLYEELALDPYVFMRNAYLQRRDYLMKRNKHLEDPYKTVKEDGPQEDYYLDE